MSRAADSDYQFVSADIDTILNTLIAQYELTTGRTVKPSSPERLFLSWIASAFVEAYAAINYAGNQNIPSRAEGDNLDAIAQLFFNNSRPSATSATVQMRFHISEAQTVPILIPVGTRVTTANGEPVFATTADVYIAAGDTYADVSCECEEEGTTGNGYAAGQINVLIDVDNILYYDHCENTDDSDGGSDVPDDDDFYDLMVAGEDAYSCAGARGAYEYWAKTVSTNIEDVVVNSPTPGVICIYILMNDGTIASTEIKNAVLDACSEESVRPLTDFVSVVDPDTVTYNINVTYYLSEDSTLSAAELEDAIEEAADEYVAWQQARLGRDINPSKLIAMLVQAGAKRVELTAPTYAHLYDGRETIVIDENGDIVENVHTPQIGQIGTITLTNGGYEDE